MLPVFVEFSPFARMREALLPDAEYRRFQAAYVAGTLHADQIPGTCGLMKARWARKGMGKRGGLRVIYLPSERHGLVLMLALYAKADREDLTRDQEAVLCDLARRLLDALG